MSLLSYSSTLSQFFLLCFIQVSGEQMVTIPLIVLLGTEVKEVKGLQFVMAEISWPSPYASGHLSQVNFWQIRKISMKKCAPMSRTSVLQLLSARTLGEPLNFHLSH